MDFSLLNNTFKVKWLIVFLKNSNSIWHAFPSYLFNLIGGIDFLLKCNFSIDKIPFRLANFHKQALLAWLLVYKHNVSPHRYYIWNNKDILHKRNSLFYCSWYDNGILLVCQLLNKNGVLMSYSELIQKFKITITPKEYVVISNAIPAGSLLFLKNCNLAETNSFGSRQIFIGDINIQDKPCSNRHIRNALNFTTLQQDNILAGEMMPLALSHCYETSLLCLPSQVSFWNRMATLVNKTNCANKWCVSSTLYQNRCLRQTKT